MTKTVDIQIEKSRKLIAAMRKDPSIMLRIGVSESVLDNMAADLDALAEASGKLDAMRQQVSLAVKQTNTITARVKNAYMAQKRLVKEAYLPEQWPNCGVFDKR